MFEWKPGDSLTLPPGDESDYPPDAVPLREWPPESEPGPA